MSNMWKKVVILSLIAVFAVLLAAVESFAATRTGDVVGVIDSMMVVTRHPTYEQAMTQLEQIATQKEREARAAMQQNPDDQARNAQIFQTMRMEMAREEQRLMAPILRDCEEAVRIVARQRNVTIVLEKASVYFGGQDITDYVVQELLRKK